MRRIFALLALAAFAGPALACDNSTELPKYEREFRSQYSDLDVTKDPPSWSAPYNATTAMVAGGVLLIGATTVTLRRRAR
jgi:hypothetical protein